MPENEELAPDPAAEEGQSAERTAAEGTVSPPREAVELDLEEYVLEWFQAQGENYEDLMNQVLRDYIAAEEAAGRNGDAERDVE